MKKTANVKIKHYARIGTGVGDTEYVSDFEVSSRNENEIEYRKDINFFQFYDKADVEIDFDGSIQKMTTHPFNCGYSTIVGKRMSDDELKRRKYKDDDGSMRYKIGRVCYSAKGFAEKYDYVAVTLTGKEIAVRKGDLTSLVSPTQVNWKNNLLPNENGGTVKKTTLAVKQNNKGTALSQ